MLNALQGRAIGPFHLTITDDHKDMLMKQISSRCKCVLALALSASAPAYALGPVDLRAYFPASDNVYRKQDGTAAARYVFFPSSQTVNSGFWNVYTSYLNLQKPGSLMVWQKMYASDANNPGNLNCTKTYGMLFMGAGADKSVVEVGDWYNEAPVPNPNGGTCGSQFGTLGYQKYPAAGYTATPTPVFSASAATGLNWSGPNGLDDSYGSYQNGYVFRQYPSSPAPYASGAPPFAEYSTPALTQIVGTWSPEYGRNAAGAWVVNPGKTYTGVIRMVLYHGTGRSGSAVPACSVQTSPGHPYHNAYWHHPSAQVNGASVANFFGSYAMEFYLSPQYGVLQETLLYDESNCATTAYPYPALVANGTPLTNSLRVWRWYIDR